MTAMTTVQLPVAVLSYLFPVSFIELLALIIHCACNPVADVSTSLITQLWYLKRMASSLLSYAFALSERQTLIQATNFIQLPASAPFLQVIVIIQYQKKTNKKTPNQTITTTKNTTPKHLLTLSRLESRARPLPVLPSANDQSKSIVS